MEEEINKAKRILKNLDYNRQTMDYLLILNLLALLFAIFSFLLSIRLNHPSFLIMGWTFLFIQLLTIFGQEKIANMNKKIRRGDFK